MSIELYPNIAKAKRNGAWQNLPGFVQQSGDADIEAMLANKETSTTAQYPHAKDSFFILNDVLYQADANISVNGTIAVGTNCHVAILSEVVAKLINDTSSTQSAIVRYNNNFTKLDESILVYEQGENIYNENDPTMMMDLYTIDDNGIIKPDANRTLLIVPIHDLTALYTLLYANSNGSYWINQTGKCGCFDINMNPLGLAQTVTNGRLITNSNTKYLAFDMNHALLVRRPMVIKNWNAINKPAYVDYSAPSVTMNAKDVSNLNDYNYQSTFKKTVNLLNLTGAVYGYYIAYDGTLTENEAFNTSGWMEVEGGAKYIINYCQHMAFYNANKQLLSRTNLEFSWTAPANAKYARIDFNVANARFEDIILVKGESLPDYVPPMLPLYHIPYSYIDGVGQWAGKKWAAYGDSITAISNGNGLNLGWSRYVNDVHKFSSFYGRGIGSQTFAWGTDGGAACFINATTGEYNSRDNSSTKDTYTGEIPEGCVLTRGSFCSWDRITHMFPASIKDTIDMIFIMGGTNDTHSDTAASFIANDTTDPEWAESDYYDDYGGDYNISVIKGGIASTVMKMQAWMPNALIIIGTPLSGEGIQGEINTTIPTANYQKSRDVLEMANILSCPCIDVYANCGINGFNRTEYIEDGVHPYLAPGKMMLGRTVTGGLVNIYPKMTVIT